MNEEKVILKAPPRLLLGVGFLFWGSMVGNPIVGFICALLMEARHWTSLRWEFGEKGFARAWQLSVLVLVVAAAVKISTEENRVTSAVAVLSMLPMVFLPLALAQQYASDRGVPLTTFSFVARRKMALDRKAGRPVRTHPCQLGYPYLGVLLAAAGLGLDDIKWYSIGVTALMGVSLMAMKNGERRPLAWSIAFLFAMCVAVGVAGAAYFGLGRLSRSLSEEEIGSTRQVQTALGQVMKLKLSSNIDWRYIQKEGSRPARLRLAVYNGFWGERWVASKNTRSRPPIPEERSAGGDFEKLFSTKGDSHRDHAYRLEDLSATGMGKAVLMGQVGDESLLPVPVNSLRFTQVPAEGMERSSMGTTRIGDPDHGSVALQIVLGGERVAEEDPVDRDLEIIKDELDGMTRFWDEFDMDLPEWGDPRDLRLPVMDQLHVDEADQMKRWAQLQMKFRKYTYTTDLRLAHKKGIITHFLKMKEGHCEYFASAATLLLRRAGIPTRYVIGYGMQETGEREGEWIIRGKHAHAWCQAYIGGSWKKEPTSTGKGKPIWRCRGGRWVDIDLTPPDWLEQDTSDDSWKQKLYDWWQMLREDIVIWFGRPLVSKVLEILMWLAGIGLVCWIIWRLWTTKTRDGRLGGGSWEARCLENHLLKDFEKWLSKRIGRRPVAMPFGDWLAGTFPDESDNLLKKYRALRFDPRADPADLGPEIDDFKKRINH